MLLKTSQELPQIYCVDSEEKRTRKIIKCHNNKRNKKECGKTENFHSNISLHHEFIWHTIAIHLIQCEPRGASRVGKF